MKAILATDFLLSVIILGSLFAVALWAFNSVDIATVYTDVKQIKPENLNIITAAGLMFLGSNFLFGCGEIFHSNIWWQRVYASSEKTASRSFTFAGLIWFGVPIVAGSLAFIAISNKYDVPQVNMIFPIVASEILGTTGSILVMVIIYAALASTVSSLLTACSGLIVNDIYRGMINKSADDKKVSRYVKFVIVILSILTMTIAWNPYESMYIVLLLTGPAVASMIWPIVFGMFKKETNKNSAFLAMIVGMPMGLIGYFYISPYSAAVLSAVSSGLVVYALTKIKPDVSFEWTELNESRLNK